MKLIISILFAISLTLSSTYADECRNAVEYQAMDILSQELNVSFEEVEIEYQITLTKTQVLTNSIEKYEALFNTYSGIYLLKMDINYSCDVIGYSNTLKY
ncbi:hypothetical protein [Halobacteriovorax sp. JY17]|uniref:hypothetical protein n=1 Tax=Halobacteriovorax sp. JY17 TaxID=2014617 RepID=UPI000C52E25F|nr:hypothetical protein [Halobacteriovorax sp. JY17]PIK16381.1 MAG: hypothetical protein CES88_06460 [Halobacteriovorax sp. JY17]